MPNWTISVSTTPVLAQRVLVEKYVEFKDMEPSVEHAV